MPRRVLLVPTAPDPVDELYDRVHGYVGDDAEVVVVAPASDVSLLEWLASDEDRAREQAAGRARAAARAVDTRRVETRVGDPDPVIAIEDALRTFPADEVIVVTRPDESASWIEKDVAHALSGRLGVPVTRLVDDDIPVEPRKDVPPIVREVARGANPFTAFIVQNMVLAIVVAVTLVILGIVLLVVHFAG